MSQKSIKIDSLSKVYSDSTGRVVNLFEDISFSIEKVSTILAPKESGKSSLMKLIAGIDEDEKSEISNAIFIPQEPSSFPWLNVSENIEFNLDINSDEVDKLIQFVGLEGYEDHHPNNKSIGFRFRISLARAIATNPKLLLIDESFSNIEPKRKLELFSLLRKVFFEKNIPVLFATSSISDAIRLSDKIILMSKNPTEIISEKLILIDEETRADSKTNISIGDYFTDGESAVFC